ncbi:uncharacterized protein LOC119668667 [Teleopsis dalmanni]|uniref:uncharacterized protein LOC119668667 n=1 Tax=Teleopsis dalmanni TaxID=139649 RepID=UPI0018CCB7AA|nr:uncharacterized protein LOC119668667 [Teleopsis dalmanni]
MQAQAYLQNYRCPCQSQNACSCPHKDLSAEAFLNNIKDIAATLVKVMIVCGVDKCNAALSAEVVIHAFLYYDDILRGIGVVPKKRLRREDLMYKFTTDCNMTLSESHLSYAIVKRAFKAFYYGTTEGGIRNTLLEAKLVHTQECLWVHAAKRTAEVFSEYEGMFYNAYSKYERHIMCLYKHLFDRIQRRAEPIAGDVCTCEDCFDSTEVKYAIPIEPVKTAYPDSKACAQLICNKTDKDIVDDNDENVCLEEEQEEKCTDSDETVKLPRCLKCTCPKLICECDVDPVTGVQNVDCGQGPFQCKWFRVKNKPIDLSKRLDRPQHHQCPVDCRGDTISLSCDSVCQCDCDVCTCEVTPTTPSESTFGEEEYEEESSEYMGASEVETESTVSVTELPRRKHFGGCRVGPPNVDDSDSDDYEYDEYGRRIKRKRKDADRGARRRSKASAYSFHDSMDSILKHGKSSQVDDILKVKKYQNFYMNIWKDKYLKPKRDDPLMKSLDSQNSEEDLIKIPFL